MPWVRFDDGILDHPKVAASLSPFGLAMHFAGIIWSSRNLSNGIVPLRVIPRLLSFEGMARDAGIPADADASYISAYRESGRGVVYTEIVPELWHDRDAAMACKSAKCREAPTPTADELLIHDFLGYQKSREDVQQERLRWREKKQSQRDSQRDIMESPEVSPGDSRAGLSPPVPVPVPVPKDQTHSAAKLRDEFDSFWDEYPRKLSKGAAMRAYAKARRSASASDILAGLHRVIDSEWSRRATDKIPYGSTWLNAEGWLDEPSPNGNTSATTRRLAALADRLESEGR